MYKIEAPKASQPSCHNFDKKQQYYQIHQ